LIGEALKNLAPASLQFGDGKTTFAVNRRNNREADIPDLLAKGTPLVGPVDHTVPVITVTREGWQPECCSVWICMSSNDAQLHDMVWRLPWIRSTGD
jgi:hypothetical protein